MCMCGLGVEVGSSRVFLTVVYSLTVYVNLVVCFKVFVCLCKCVPVAVTEQVGPLCMGSRQPVRHTTDCGQAYCAQHAVCGAGLDTLWLDVDVL